MSFPNFSKTLAGYTPSDTSLPPVKAGRYCRGRYNRLYQANDHLSRFGDWVDPTVTAAPGGRNVLLNPVVVGDLRRL